MLKTQPLIVGIDLGTTHCAVSYCEKGKIHSFPILQQGLHKDQEHYPLFPSCLFLGEKEDEDVVGYWALECGKKTPTRLIHSAKSWLAHAAAAREDPILPSEAIDEERKLSPVSVTTRLLDHIRRMWNAEKSLGKIERMLEELEVVITIPASFDEVARALTLKAAKEAGLQKVRLLEEPMAAMYAYLESHNVEDWENGTEILVCDIGGGTSDFSLMVKDEQGLQRVAVGRHLLLGGDNIDLYIATKALEQIEEDLTSTQWLSLLQQAKASKEKLPNDCSFFIPGSGKSLVGSGIQVQLSGIDLQNQILDGFFGLYSKEEAKKIQMNSGVKEMGLSYEADPSITKQLAHFLTGANARPSYVLFNGGTLHPSSFRQRIVTSLEKWFGTTKQLTSESLDLAVCRGAVLFGQGKLKIKSALPRSFYLGVTVSSIEETKALTLLERGTEPGNRFTPDSTFKLRTNQPAQFSLYHSHTRVNDIAGDLVTVDEEQFYLLPPIQTQLKFGKQSEVEVKLQVELTEIGTVSLSLVTLDQSHTWNLEFGLSGEDKVRKEDVLESKTIQEIGKTIREIFAVGSTQQLIPTLEQTLGLKKQEWSCSMLRAMSDPLLKLSDKRDLAVHYGVRFWNMVGFALRPGIGHPLDPHRIKELWKIILADQQRKPSYDVILQQWICYRRIAAGLTKGQQVQLFHSLSKEKTKDQYAYAEKIRALAAFERVDEVAKVKLGKTLIGRIEEGKGEPCDYWAIARLGARKLLYGSLADVLPKAQVESWVERLFLAKDVDEKHFSFALATLATSIGNRSCDLSSKTVQRIKERVGEVKVDFESTDLNRLFGDTLPPGIILQGELGL